MTNRLTAILIILPIWLALVIIFRRHRQWLLYYLVAAFGLTIELVFAAEYFGWDQILVNISSYHVNLISKMVFHLPMELMSNGRFQILTMQGSSVLKLGIECSAILESSVILALIFFYPLFNPAQKLLRIGFGLVLTYVINIIRLMIIVLMAYRFGTEYIFVAHAGVARVFFFLCELLLYWYLMTKPTVKVVGESIEKRTELAKTAVLGRSFKLRHAIIQSVVIFVFLGLTATSFLISDEWRKAFGDMAKVKRPLIYQEETTIEPLGKNTPAPAANNKAAPAKSPTPLPAPAPVAVLPPDGRVPEGSLKTILGAFAPTDEFNRDFVLDLQPGERTVLKYHISEDDRLNVQVLSGQQGLAARLVLNTVDIGYVSFGKWRFKKYTSIFEPFNVEEGDNLQIRFQNISEKPARYLIKIYSSKEEYGQ